MLVRMKMCACIMEDRRLGQVTDLPTEIGAARESLWQ